MGKILHVWILTRYKLLHLCHLHRTCVWFLRCAELVICLLVCLQTQLLENILMKDYGGCDDLILGELQFAFIAFLVRNSWTFSRSFQFDIFFPLFFVLHVFEGTFIDIVENCWAYLASVILQMGQSLEAFFQWKSLVSLFLGCTEAVSIGFWLLLLVWFYFLLT